MTAESPGGCEKVAVYFHCLCILEVGFDGSGHISAHFGGNTACTVEIYGFDSFAQVAQFGNKLIADALAHLFFG